LQAYLGEQWDLPSDLDIYIPYEDPTSDSDDDDLVGDEIIQFVIQNVTRNLMGTQPSVLSHQSSQEILYSELSTATGGATTSAATTTEQTTNEENYLVSTIHGPYIHPSINAKITQINLSNGRKIQLIFVRPF
jgi:hypothetical protein